MERETHDLDDIVDLGTVRIETRGLVGPLIELSGLAVFPGINHK